MEQHFWTITLAGQAINLNTLIMVWAGMGRHILLFDKTVYEAQMAAELSRDEVVDFFKV